MLVRSIAEAGRVASCTDHISYRNTHFACYHRTRTRLSRANATESPRNWEQHHSVPEMIASSRIGGEGLRQLGLAVSRRCCTASIGVGRSATHGNHDAHDESLPRRCARCAVLGWEDAALAKWSLLFIIIGPQLSPDDAALSKQIQATRVPVPGQGPKCYSM